MNFENKRLTNSEIVILLSGLITLIALLFTFTRPPFYDEDDYLQNVALLHQYGFSNTYLIKLTGSAGPLYSTVHYLLEPFTRLQAPYIRLVNIVMLLGAVFFISRTLKLLGYSSWTYSLSIMAIPMTYVVSGLALTEVPAIFFLSAGLYLIIKTTFFNQSFSKAVIPLSAGGMCVSLAILGRQPFLLLLVAVPVLFFHNKNQVKSLILLLLTLAFSLGFPCYVFFLWKGLVAPSDALFYKDIANQGVLYRLDFFLLCLGYFSVILAIIAPGFYKLKGNKEILLLLLTFITLAVVNYKFEVIRILPLQGVIEKIFPTPGIIQLAEILFGAGIALLGLYFLVTLIRQLHYAEYQKHLVFYSVALILLALTCIKITYGFSSRYAAQAIPILIPFGSYFYRRNNTNVLRYGAGVIIGLLSILSYLLD